jgi:hypothetical protein
MNDIERAKNEYRKNNKSYLGLTDEQCDMHYDMMKMKMNEWPQTLRDYCQAQSKQYGFCGDALACWVADWLKQGNVYVDPLSGESEEEAERGRLKALAMLGGPRNADQ